MQARAFGIVGNFDVCIWQFGEFIDRFSIRRTHIRGCDDAEMTAFLSEFAQLIDDEAQPAPLNEGNQHVDAVCRLDFFFEL